MAGGGGGRRNISYVQNEEPAFIKAFKQKVGYKEGPTIDSKRETLEYEQEDRSDTEEEKPVVVVLKEGDLTAEEANTIKRQTKDIPVDDEDDATPPADGKITFKKPVKMSTEETSDLNASTNKKAKEEKVKKKSSAKKVKNSSLLSFDEEEEDVT